MTGRLEAICHLCPSAASGLYPAGPACDAHTPAAVFGRDPAPPPTGRLDVLSDLEHDRLVEVAIAKLDEKQHRREQIARRHNRGASE